MEFYDKKKRGFDMAGTLEYELLNKNLEIGGWPMP